jgi:hypothetical protein
MRGGAPMRKQARFRKNPPVQMPAMRLARVLSLRRNARIFSGAGELSGSLTPATNHVSTSAFPRNDRVFTAMPSDERTSPPATEKFSSV